MIPAPVWSSAELERDRREAEGVFRRERMEEPREVYLRVLAEFETQVSRLLDVTGDLTKLGETEPATPVIQQVLEHNELLRAARYLTAPPISEDDLKTLVEASSLTPRRLAADPDLLRRVAEVLMAGIDCRRFPGWNSSGPRPQRSERRPSFPPRY